MTLFNTPAIHPGVRYRADIDGIRALAVIPVLLFHAGVPGFAGGYVGVDIFFVISGYLITEVLHRDWQAGTFSIAKFYERRARRILPALFTVMALSSIFAVAIMVPPDLKEFAASVFASATFWSNFLFWAQDGYFTAASHYKPLLHTWSLSVEEQFYILYPLALWFILRLRNARAIYVALLVATFLGSVWAAGAHQNSAFYLSPFRAWELLLGGALVVLNPPAFKSQLLSEFAAFGALCSIAASFFTFDTATQVPGFPALLPCLATALLLHIGRDHKPLLNRLLEWRPLVAVGLISYSLYLWHWPLLAFARLYLLRPLGAVETGLALTASFFLAVASWYFIEKPFRKHSVSKVARRYFAVTASAIFIFLVGITYSTNGLPQRFTPRVNHLASFENRPDIRSSFARLGLTKCFDFQDASNLPQEVDDCLPSSKNQPSVVVWGDSHAAMYYAGLMENPEFRKLNVSVAALASCAPVSGSRGPRNCPTFIATVNHRLKELKPTVVVLAGFWDSLNLPNQELVSRLRSTVGNLRSNGSHIILVGPGIEFDESLPVLLARDASRSRTGTDHSKTGIVVEDAILAKEFTGVQNVTYVSVARAMCPHGVCRKEIYGEPITVDESHLTRKGAAFVAEAVIAPALHHVLNQNN